MLNDALHEIRRDPKFGEKLADAISGLGNTPIDVSAGCHCNAATVIETHHADYYVLVKVGGNHGEIVEGGS